MSSNIPGRGRKRSSIARSMPVAARASTSSITSLSSSIGRSGPMRAYAFTPSSVNPRRASSRLAGRGAPGSIALLSSGLTDVTVMPTSPLSSL